VFLVSIYIKGRDKIDNNRHIKKNFPREDNGVAPRELLASFYTKVQYGERCSTPLESTKLKAMIRWRQQLFLTRKPTMLQDMQLHCSCRVCGKGGMAKILLSSHPTLTTHVMSTCHTPCHLSVSTVFPWRNRGGRRWPIRPECSFRS
jgi:hypothetical protein